MANVILCNHLDKSNEVHALAGLLSTKCKIDFAGHNFTPTDKKVTCIVCAVQDPVDDEVPGKKEPVLA